MGTVTYSNRNAAAYAKAFPRSQSSGSSSSSSGGGGTTTVNAPGDPSTNYGGYGSQAAWDSAQTKAKEQIQASVNKGQTSYSAGVASDLQSMGIQLSPTTKIYVTEPTSSSYQKDVPLNQYVEKVQPQVIQQQQIVQQEQIANQTFTNSQGQTYSPFQTQDAVQLNLPKQFGGGGEFVTQEQLSYNDSMTRALQRQAQITGDYRNNVATTMTAEDKALAKKIQDTIQPLWTATGGVALGTIKSVIKKDVALPYVPKIKESVINFLTPPPGSSYMYEPGASTRTIIATNESISRAKQLGESGNTWTTKEAGYPRQVAAGLVEMFPGTVQETAKAAATLYVLGLASKYAPIPLKIGFAGLGVKSVPDYFKSAPGSQEKRLAAASTLGLLEVPGLYPRARGEVIAIIERIKGNKEVPMSRLVPPKALSGEEAYPLAPVKEHLRLFQEFSQRLPGQRPEVPVTTIQKDYAKYNLYKQLKEGPSSSTPEGHGLPHAEAVAKNINKLVDAYPEYNEYFIKKYGSVDNAKVTLTNAMWHDLTKIVGSSKTDEFTIFGKKHGPAFEELYKSGNLPSEIKINAEISKAVKVHEETFGHTSPEAKILATADRLDLTRYGMKVDPNKLPLKDAINRVKNIPEPSITIPKFTSEMGDYIKSYEKKYAVSFSTGEVVPKSKAPAQFFHATGDIFWKKGITKISSSKSEIPGLYGAPFVSPRFLKLAGSDSRYSLIPKIQEVFKGMRPGVLVTTPSKIVERQAIKVPEYSIGQNKYVYKIPGELKAGEAYVTKIKPEVELVIPPTSEVPGQGLQFTGRKGYFRYSPPGTKRENIVSEFLKGTGRFGVVVPIDTAKLINTRLVGGVKIGKSSSNVNLKEGKSSYNLPTPEPNILISKIPTYRSTKTESVIITSDLKQAYRISKSYTPISRIPSVSYTTISRISSSYNPRDKITSRVIGESSRITPTSSRVDLIERPITPSKPYVPYKPVTPYKPYTPYKPVPYKPYIPYKPYTPYKPIPITKYDESKITLKSKKKLSGRSKAFDVQIKRRGIWESQRVSLSERQAGLFAQEKLRGSLAASARLIPTRKAIQKSNIGFIPKAGEFRQYNINKGKKLFNPRLFIQNVGGKGKPFSRLGTRAERMELNVARQTVSQTRKKGKGGFFTL